MNNLEEEEQNDNFLNKILLMYLFERERESEWGGRVVGRREGRGRGRNLSRRCRACQGLISPP